MVSFLLSFTHPYCIAVGGAVSGYSPILAQVEKSSCGTRARERIRQQARIHVQLLRSRGVDLGGSHSRSLTWLDTY